MDEKRELLDLLLTDARESTENIARQTGIDQERVEELIAELEADGVVQGYQAIVDWREVDEEHVEALVDLNVELDRETKYDDIARRLSQFHEVDSLRLVSGDYDFSVTITGDSMHDISRFVADQIAPIPEVTQTVTHFVMETYKDRGVELADGDGDDRLSISP